MAAHRSPSCRSSTLGAGCSGRGSTGSGRRARARVWSMAFRWAIVTSQASTLLPGRRVGYARNAAKNVSDHASSASIGPRTARHRSEEHTSELQSRGHLVCRLLLEKKKTNNNEEE